MNNGKLELRDMRDGAIPNEPNNSYVCGDGFMVGDPSSIPTPESEGLIDMDTATAIDKLKAHRHKFNPLSLLVIAVALVSVGLGLEMYQTHQRNEVWKTEESLWQDAIGKSPRNGRAWMNYGVAQMAKGKWTEAEYDFNRARLYAPAYDLVEVNLGVLCAATGRNEEARFHFKEALRLGPNDPTVIKFYSEWVGKIGTKEN